MIANLRFEFDDDLFLWDYICNKRSPSLKLTFNFEK